MDSSRIGLIGTGLVAVTMAAWVGCSSSSSPATTDAGGTSSGSTSSSGSSSGGTTTDCSKPVNGTGMSCSKTYPLSVGTLITVDVSWLGTAAVAGCPPKCQNSTTTGTFYIWLLTTYTADSGKITGTTYTCGNTPAVLTLSQTGDMSLGVPAGQTGQIKPTYPAASWDGTPGATITGTLGGKNVGSSFAIDKSVVLYGLKPSDPLSDPSMAWPTSNTALTQSDLTYADGGAYVSMQGHPGIKGTFDGTPPFYLAGTAITPGSPNANTFYSVTRSEIAMCGSSVSCTETTGTATVTLLNNRVVGCDLVDGGPCTTDQFGFLDANTTQYTPGKATFDAKDLKSGATCTDVLAAFPAPSM